MGKQSRVIKKRRHNIRLIKKGTSYSIQDIANLFNLHTNAVRQWLKAGLPRIDKQKPYLVHGSDLYNFLNAKQIGRKHHCEPNQLFCCKCQKPRTATNNHVTIKILNQKQLQIYGRCTECKASMVRVGSVKKLLDYQKTFVINKIEDQHLIDTSPPSAKCYFDKELNNDQI